MTDLKNLQDCATGCGAGATGASENGMKLLEFRNDDERSQVIELVSEFIDISAQPSKTTLDAFNVRCVVDSDGTLRDYEIFDPRRNCFDGYLNPSGWSHWQTGARDYMPEEERREFDKLIERDEVSLKRDILESMKTLIENGVSLTTGDYVGVFQEFAEINGFDLETVVEVYHEHEAELGEMWSQYCEKSYEIL